MSILGHRGLMLAGVYDPYWPSVSALLHMDGSNGSTTFTDETGKVWTPSGNAQISTASAKFGQSAVFDGSGDWVDGPSSADFTFGTGDFTLECWANFTNLSANRALLSLGSDWTLYGASNGNLYVYNGAINILDGGAQATGAWHHIAVSRQGNTIRLFRNGAQVASATNSANMTSTNMRIGSATTGASNMLGYIDEVRITKGVARYTAAFTPPSSPFPDV